MTIFILLGTLIGAIGIFELFSSYKQSNTNLKQHHDVMAMYRQFELARERRQLGVMKNLAQDISKVESDLAYINLDSDDAASKHQEAA